MEIQARDFDLIQPAADRGAGHFRCWKEALPIGHCPLWQTLPAVPCNRSVRRKHHRGHHRKVPNHFYPLPGPCCDLPGQFPPSCPSESLTQSLLSGRLLRALADTSLTSLLPLTLQQRLCPGPNRAAQFLATTSPKHSSPQSHQTCLLQSHPIATLRTPATGGGCPQLAFQNATIPLKKPRSLNLSLCQLAVRVRSLLGNRQQQQQQVGREPQAPLRKALPNASLSPPGSRRTKSILRGQKQQRTSHSPQEAYCRMLLF